MPPLSTNNSLNNNNLFNPQLSLTLSHHRQTSFDCQSATKFSTNKPNSLYFPFFSSGVPLQNHTTPLALKRFPCGYEGHHLSTIKVQSPTFNRQQFSPFLLCNVRARCRPFLTPPQPQSTTTKSPRCPR